jgi:hypothetical protein
MKLFSKEKDIVLKIVNSILIVGAIISIIVVISTGINLINRPQVLSYEDYEKDVCTIDKLEYEGTDTEGEKDYYDENVRTCKEYYKMDKRDAVSINKTNMNNFLISLATTVVFLITIHILNKKM